MLLSTKSVAAMRIVLFVLFIITLVLFFIPTTDHFTQRYLDITQIKGFISVSDSPDIHDAIIIPKLKILHLIDYNTFDSLTDRWFMHSHKAFASRPDLISSAELWGHGFPGWNPNISIAENIAQRFGRADYFDASLVYFNTDQVTHRIGNFDLSLWFSDLRQWSQVGRGTLLVERPHELRDMRKAQFYQAANISVVLAPYPSELFDYAPLANSNSMLLIHQPHFIDADLFYHPVTLDSPRSRDVTLAGALIPEWYPFRHRLAWMIEEGMIKGGWVKLHPGYGDLVPLGERPQMNISAANQELKLQSFSRELGDSKICFVTSSRYGYSVQKYLEAAAAGCLVIGNVPLDRSTLFRSNIVPISNKDSNDTIASTVAYWLTHEEERVEKARRAQEMVIGEFGLGKYVEDVSRHLRAAQAGQRGMVLPWEWHPTPDPLPDDG